MSAAPGGDAGGNRRLRIVVGSLPIEDGATRPPAVGAVDHYRLTFREVDDGTDDAPGTSDIRARAEPAGDGSPLGPGRAWDGTPHDGPTTWPTVLHGDGWSAHWSAPRPVIGEVRLRGVLGDHLDIDARTGVRARVRRVRLITQTIDTSADDQRDWRPVPAERRLRDVETAPRWFDRGLVVPPGATAGAPAGSSVFVSPVPADPYVVETGVLVDLDLDDVPPLPPRPSIVPGSVDACGDDLWIVDTRLPLVVRVRRPGDDRAEVVAYRWAGRILGVDERRTVHAAPGGCWLTGPDGVHRVDDDGVRQLDDAWNRLAAVDGRALVAGVLREPGRLALCRYEPDGARVEAGLGDRGLLGLVTGGAGVVAMLSGGEGRRAAVATVDAAGTLREGPELSMSHTWDQLVAGDPVLVRDGAHGANERLRPLRDDLTLGDGAELGRMMLTARGAAGRLWVVIHPPHPYDIERRGAAACWPLAQPPSYPDDRQYWLLTELDPESLEPVVTTLVPGVPDRVAVDGTGTVWVLADGVRRVPPGDGAAATPLDVAALLDGSGAAQAP